MKQEVNPGWMKIQWKRVLFGGVVSTISTMALVGGFAGMLSHEIIGMDWMPYLAVAVILLSSMIGAGAAGNRGMIVNQVASGFVYWVILLTINALAFGGDLGGLIPTLAAIMGGCAAAVLLFQRGNVRTKHRRRRYHHR